MKKQILALGIAGVALLALAAKSADPVLMTINGKDVRLSEFEYLYHKNNSQQVEPQTLDEYVEMFVNYKLKVADAEAAGIDTTAAFVKEFTQFRDELAAPYLVDNSVLDSLVEQNYLHMSKDLYVSHIMMNTGKEAILDSLRTAILDGTTTFEDVARQYSIDTPSARRGGLMGWVVAGRYPWPFEEAAFKTAVGEVSPVINSGFGIHIIRVEKERRSNEVLCEHILRLTVQKPDSAAALEEARIDSIYNELMRGADFADLARRLSEDPGSAAKGGRLDWFGAGVMVNEFDSVAFAMPSGTISRPFRTSYGWHIIHKIDERGKGTLEENREAIIRSFGNDERGSLPRRKFMQQQIVNYKGKLNDKAFTRIAKWAEELGGTVDSTMTATFAASDLHVFTLNGKKYTLAQVMPQVPVSALKGGEQIAALIRSTAFNVMGEAAIDLAREDLVNTNPDYRNLVNEYRDGILLFEISNRNVWQRAADNKDELEQFFAANRDKYSWGGTEKFKSYIIFASNDSILAEAMQFAETMPLDVVPADFTKQMRDKFGRDVKVERVIAAKGENAITDFLAFGGEKPTNDNARWPSYAAFRGRLITAPEEAADVRGLVVSDFQADLERRWVESLRAKYSVKINTDVLQQVK